MDVIVYGVTEILGQHEDMWLVDAVFFKDLAAAKKHVELDVQQNYGLTHMLTPPYNWVYKQWGYHKCMVHKLTLYGDITKLIVECVVN